MVSLHIGLIGLLAKLRELYLVKRCIARSVASSGTFFMVDGHCDGSYDEGPSPYIKLFAPSLPIAQRVKRYYDRKPCSL